MDLDDIDVIWPSPWCREKKNALNTLGRSIQEMSDCDAVYFAPGWENARGCKIEHECAVQYGKKIVPDCWELDNEK